MSPMLLPAQCPEAQARTTVSEPLAEPLVPNDFSGSRISLNEDGWPEWVHQAFDWMDCRWSWLGARSMAAAEWWTVAKCVYNWETPVSMYFLLSRVAMLMHHLDKRLQHSISSRTSAALVMYPTCRCGQDPNYQGHSHVWKAMVELVGHHSA